jgi:hypothetical protein
MRHVEPMRTSLVLCAVFMPACTCGILGGGGDDCTPGSGGDAGSSPRALAEPCDEGTDTCDTGLSCTYEFVDETFTQSTCLAPCSDAGTCGTGTACIALRGATPSCHKTCASASDCSGRFGATCFATDAGTGVCLAFACGTTVTTAACAGGLRCVRPLYCCPPGAPCAAPRPGVCVP